MLEVSPRAWRRIGLNLCIALTLFGAVWDYGAAASGASLFWVFPQFACAGLCLLFATADLSAGLGRWAFGLLAVFVVLLIWAGFPLLHPAFDAGGQRISPIDRYALVVEVVRLAGFAALFVCGYAQGSDRRAGRLLFDMILVLGVAYAIWAVLAFQQTPDMVRGLDKQMHLGRLTASFLSANTAGAFFGALSCAAAVRAARKGGSVLVAAVERGVPASAWTTVLLYGLAVIILWSALLLTLSRTAIAVSVGVLLLFLTYELVKALSALDDRRARILIGGGALSLLLAVVAALFASRLTDKFAQLQADVATRVDIAQAFGPALKATPLFGYGLGGFSSLGGHLIAPSTAGVLWNLGAAHNLVLQWWLETGIVGVALGGLLLAMLLGRLIWRYFRSKMERWRAGAALAASLVLILHSLTDIPLQIGAVTALFALLLGWGAAEVREEVRGRSRPKAFG
ncbi:MAG: hypothetical protein BGN86_03465 [Caulobacterales bacterium 68-7]|nr:MAG: hypothetical protein BGN86_03465 [Caulobacterales bacterium 68-7]